MNAERGMGRSHNQVTTGLIPVLTIVPISSHASSQSVLNQDIEPPPTCSLSVALDKSVSPAPVVYI